MGYYRSNSAVSDDLTVVCMPGYTFPDGNNVQHKITCDKPPYWNWDSVPVCFPVNLEYIFLKIWFVLIVKCLFLLTCVWQINEALGWKCPIEPSGDSNLTGQIFFTQAKPRESIRMKGFSYIFCAVSFPVWKKKNAVYLGQLIGLKSDRIQTLDIENTTASCYLTQDPVVGSPSQQEVLVIENFTLNVDGILNSSKLALDETFQFHFRLIGSQHVQQRQDNFKGVAVFVVEQKDKTIGVYSSRS